MRPSRSSRNVATHQYSDTSRIQFETALFQAPSSLVCSPSFSQNSVSFVQNSGSSLLQNTTLETVFRSFPKYLVGEGRAKMACGPTRVGL